jgi:hypothetical protein
MAARSLRLNIRENVQKINLKKKKNKRERLGPVSEGSQQLKSDLGVSSKAQRVP